MYRSGADPVAIRSSIEKKWTPKYPNEDANTKSAGKKKVTEKAGRDAAVTPRAPTAGEPEVPRSLVSSKRY